MTVIDVVPSRLVDCWVFMFDDGEERTVNIDIEDMPIWTFPEQFEHGLFWGGLNPERIDNLVDAYCMWVNTIDEYTKDECMIAWQDFCRDGVD